MKKLFFITIISIGYLLSSCQNNELSDVEKKQYQKELSGYAKSYMKELKGVLLSNMKLGGPLKAVNVCSDTAADLSDSFAKYNDVEVKRVSFKNRNPNNRPDDFESKALKTFEKLLSEGKLETSTSIIEKSKIDGAEAVRFVKPIMVDAPCLNCHGTETQISNKVAKVINEKYPNDKAFGYEIGDLRGVISVTKVL